MSILIGCSPSSGSSLLRRLLNRHSEIFCGSETSLFAKEELYLDWKKNKGKINRPSLFGLSNAGWHNLIGVELTEEYGYNPKEFRELLKKNHKDFSDFISDFYKPILESNKKSVWAEKTPSNAFTLEFFLERFEKGKVIHIVRNPYDAISSLYSRGMTLYNAVAVYLLNTAKALELKGNERCITIKYEDLVDEPKKILEIICSKIGLAYEEQMLVPSMAEGGVTHMSGWNYKETEPIRQGSVGRFQLLDEETQSALLTRIAITSTNLTFASRTIKGICRSLGYSIIDGSEEPSIIDVLEREKKEDIKRRHFSRAYFRKSNYPIIFSSELI